MKCQGLNEAECLNIKLTVNTQLENEDIAEN